MLVRVGTAAGMVLLLGASGGGIGRPAPSEPARIGLYSVGAALAVGGGPDPADAGYRYYAGTRVVAPGELGAIWLAEGQRTWMAASCLPPSGDPWHELAATSLLDLRTLLTARGALLAGPSPRWRYVWPRDAAFGAAALAATGHPDDGLRVVDFVARQQHGNGVFEARYLPDGSGVPDGRGIQLDGTGWVLWGLSEVVARLPGERRRLAVVERRALLDRSAEALLRLTGRGRTLPPPSPDYWERPERRVTLGTVAPLLAGMRAAAALYAQAGDPGRARQLAAAHDRFRRLVLARFGGFERYPRRGGADTAVTMMLPPYQGTADGRVMRATLEAFRRLRQPAGGVTPGERWRDDQVSWTPATAMFGLAFAAGGHPEAAEDVLGWLRDHRTVQGAIPEKVLADGSPAAVAPLAWTDALVLLILDRLQPFRCADDGAAAPPGGAAGPAAGRSGRL